METIIAQLFAARDIAHKLHLSTRSFSAHLALGDLYDELVDLADSLSEMHQGKYGLMNVSIEPQHFSFNSTDAVTFIRELAQWAENTKAVLPQDSHLISEWDMVVALIYKTKYKLENLA